MVICRRSRARRRTRKSGAPGRPTQRLKALKAAVAQAEAAVAQAEQEQAELEALMAAPETYQDAAKAAELGRRYQQIQQEVARRYEAWEQAEAELEKKNKALFVRVRSATSLLLHLGRCGRRLVAY